MVFFLFLAGALGGALNAVAGGGSFICLPALLYAGVPPVAANATSAFALWPGSVSSTVAYRRELKTTGKWLPILVGVSLAGGLIGAILLIRTSDTSFMRLLPWLMLIAAAAFTFGDSSRPGRRTPGRGRLAVILLAQFAISIYGGYFGGGMGIMMLATLSVAGMTDIHEMNGLKSLLAVAINGVAVVEFIFTRTVVWGPGVVMIAGSILGGYVGAALARRIDRRWIRGMVIVVGWGMTVFFFFR